MPRYIAHLIGHPVMISLVCKCRCLSVRPGYLLDKLGLEATIELAEERLRCPKCKQRPVVRAEAEWSVSGGRDKRTDAPKMPGWVGLG